MVESAFLFRARLRLVAREGRVVTGDDDRILDEATDWLLLLAEAPGDHQLQTRLHRWLAQDPRHNATWRDLNQSYDLIGQTQPAMTELWQEAGHAPSPLQRLRQQGVRLRQSNLFRHHGRKVPLAAAGAALLAMALFGPDAMLAIRADERTGTGQLRLVRLADGSTAQLGPGSAIAVHDGDGERNIDLLQGEALFQVRPDPAHPFRVHAGTVTTTVLGTGFDVRRLPHATQVDVQHGRVRVEDGTAEAAILTAGDQIEIGKDGQHRRDHTAPALIASWSLGEVNARDRTVAEVIDDIRPWYRGRIIVADAAMATRRVNGVYNARNPQQAVTSIATSLGGRVTLITPWLLLIGS